jgi:hypothetical protein
MNGPPETLDAGRTDLQPRLVLQILGNALGPQMRLVTDDSLCACKHPWGRPLDQSSRWGALAKTNKSAAFAHPLNRARMRGVGS